MTTLPLAAGATVAAARRALTSAFRAAGLESPELDARVLVGHALGLDRTGVVAAESRLLAPNEIAAITALATRRLTHEPVTRICGQREFWSLNFHITPDVLDPRPDTETIVEAALAALGPARRRDALRIADFGTGSGALLIALLHELPNAHGVATDRSLAALRVARANAATLGVAPRASFVACDYGSALAGGQVSGYDVIVTNPPYIPTRDIANLAAEVRDHDPAMALDGGPDGLAAYRDIAGDAPRLLRPGGLIVIECGYGQADAVAMLFNKAGLSIPQPARADLGGIPRALVAVSTTAR